MSGIPTHLGDSVRPADVQNPSANPKSSPNRRDSSLHGGGTGYAPTSTDGEQKPAQTSSTAGFPTPTGLIATSNAHPPPPQPGAIPVAANTTVKGSVPPPPKVGERPKPPEFYSPQSATSQYPANLPPPTSYHPPFQDPPRSSTSTDNEPSFKSPAPAANLQTFASSAKSDLGHPPGYQQNPFATDMTSEQRGGSQQEGPPTSLGQLDGRYGESGSARLDEVGEAVGKAKHWATQKGSELAGQVGELHGKVWDSLQGKR